MFGSMHQDGSCHQRESRHDGQHGDEGQDTMATGRGRLKLHRLFLIVGCCGRYGHPIDILFLSCMPIKSTLPEGLNIYSASEHGRLLYVPRAVGAPADQMSELGIKKKIFLCLPQWLFHTLCFNSVPTLRARCAFPLSGTFSGKPTGRDRPAMCMSLGGIVTGKSNMFLTSQ